MTNKLEILKIPVTDFAQNCRIMFSPQSLNAVIIDPGGEGSKILKICAEKKLKVKEIWLTHSHLDHCGGVFDIVEKTSAKLYGSEIEKVMRAQLENILVSYGISHSDMKNCPEPDIYLKGGEMLKFENVEFEVLFTPGHSPGHLCFYNKDAKMLIAGDTVFDSSIGRTDLPGGDHQTLIKSIKEKILTLPDNVKILPGHGPDTSVKKERDTNPFLA